MDACEMPFHWPRRLSRASAGSPAQWGLWQSSPCLRSLSTLSPPNPSAWLQVKEAFDIYGLEPWGFANL